MAFGVPDREIVVQSPARYYVQLEDGRCGAVIGDSSDIDGELYLAIYIRMKPVAYPASKVSHISLSQYLDYCDKLRFSP